MRRLFSRRDGLERVEKELRQYLRGRLQKQGDQEWIKVPEIKTTPRGDRYCDYVLMRKTITGRIEEVDRKHYDPDDEEFINLL